MNQKLKQKEESRFKILQAASRLFREKGYHATGVDELMEKAGLTAGAFYAHFKSKQDLLNHSLVFCMGENKARLLQGTEKLKGLPFIEAVLRRYVSEIHRDHPEAGCPLPSVASELPRHSEESAELVSQYLNKLANSMAEHLSGTKEQKRERALQLMSQAVGAVLLSRMTRGKLSKEILKACQKP